MDVEIQPTDDGQVLIRLSPESVTSDKGHEYGFETFTPDEAEEVADRLRGAAVQARLRD